MPVLGFIGTGNMGGALARAAAKRDNELLLANRHPEKAQALIDEIGGKLCTNEEVAQQADFIFLGVKPQMMADMLEEIKPVLARRRDRFFLVTMAAALTMEQIQQMEKGEYLLLLLLFLMMKAIYG